MLNTKNINIINIKNIFTILPGPSDKKQILSFILNLLNPGNPSLLNPGNPSLLNPGNPSLLNPGNKVLKNSNNIKK